MRWMQAGENSLELAAGGDGVVVYFEGEASDEGVSFPCRLFVDDEAEARLAVRAESGLSRGKGSVSARRPSTELLHKSSWAGII
jgi:hypothetical protein